MSDSFRLNVRDWGAFRIHIGDCRTSMQTMPAGSVQTCVTSPPYFGLRDYGVDGQIGLEPTPAEYVAEMVAVFREAWRVLRDDGTLWLNLGDSYANDTKRGGATSGKHVQAVHGNSGIGRNRRTTGLPGKNLIGIPWRVAFALQADGWYLRQDIIWRKPNPMPESVRDRCTKSHEYLFLLTKNERYYFDSEAMKEPVAASSLKRWEQDVDQQKGSDRVPGKTNGPMKAVGGPRSKRDSFKRDDSKRAQVIPGQTVGTHREDRAESDYDLFTRNKRSVWDVPTKPYSGAHFATFPPDLIRPCVLAGTSEVGGCVTCGAAWRRVLERTPMQIDRSKRTHELGRTRTSGTMVASASSRTTGWAAACKCTRNDAVPQLVLDPFGGAGTTGLVALEHKRIGVLCELNPAYAELAERRIASVMLPGVPL